MQGRQFVDRGRCGVWYRWLSGVVVLLLVVQSVFLCMPASAAGEVSVVINGGHVQFDQPPLIENDRLLVPVRAVAERLGGQIGWFADTRWVVIVLGDVTVGIQIDNPVMTVNEQPVQLEAVPKIVGDRTLIPLRAVAEAFSCEVEWVPALSQARIRTYHVAALPDLSTLAGARPAELYEMFGLPGEQTWSEDGKDVLAVSYDGVQFSSPYLDDPRMEDILISAPGYRLYGISVGIEKQAAMACLGASFSLLYTNEYGEDAACYQIDAEHYVKAVFANGRVSTAFCWMQ